MIDKANNTISTQAARAWPEKVSNGASSKQTGGFDKVLDQEMGRRITLSVSAHATKRLNSSRVTLTESDMQRIDGAVQRLRDKGSVQSVVMLDNLALVVSVKNSVVITAIDEARASKPVFTNIDSVVIA